jgi:carbamoyltransferase
MGRMKKIESVGMNKFGHHASACLITSERDRFEVEIFLKERLTRKKAAGGSLFLVLKAMASRFDPSRTHFFENSVHTRPEATERTFDKNGSYFRILAQSGLASSSVRFNPDVRFVPHHLCHATAAAALSPFDDSLIVVLDGAGNLKSAFDRDDLETASSLDQSGPGMNALPSEACTVYLQRGKTLSPVYKEWQAGRKNWEVSLGIFYETASKYIFNSPLEAGKVMGLASFGKPEKIRVRSEYLKNLNWNDSFRGRGKKQWESSIDFKKCSDMAASVQEHYEESLIKLLRKLKRKFPRVENLILTGGCALNCQANSVVMKKGLFKRIYVPPFPGDESIGFGAASYGWYHHLKKPWQRVPWKRQKSNFGPKSSIPRSSEVKACFSGFHFVRKSDISRFCAELLSEGHVIGWFQGRSESGPRALGHRSLLASPLKPSIRNHLNDVIKGRESFRPFAPSCIQIKAHEYFEVDRDFESPFMSFAPKVRKRYRKLLEEVSHVDGTARVQTVHSSQNPGFHALIKHFGKLTGVHCVLNTSLNVMGEPLVETIEDAKRFLTEVPIHGIAVEDFFIYRGKP